MRIRTATTQDAIVVAARKQFLTNGYAGTTLDEIAKQAGVTKRTIYGYFPDKRALFVGVVEQIVGTRWLPDSATDNVMTTEDLRAALTTLAVALENVIIQPEYIQLLRIAITEVHVQPDLTLLFERSVTRQSYGLVAQLFSNAVDNHIIGKNDPEILARQFIGSFAIRVLLDGLLQPESTIEQQTNQQLELDVVNFVSQIAKNSIV